MQKIYNYTLENLEKTLLEQDYKKFNATQIYDWIYKKRIKSFDEMSNIKQELIIYLKNKFNIQTLDIVDKQIDIDVVKYLFKLEDNNKIEAVFMKHNYGNSLCISTQVGCNMSCTFCESGRLKKIRNLTSDEMVEQIIKIEEDLNLRISHLVLMGIGEPFDNYDNVINFIDIINNPKGLELGARHITISTCGLIPKIKEFANLDKQVNLAISLHAPNDEIRNKIMPINKAYPINELIKAIKDYINKTSRRITFEYIMLKDINDTEKCAIELSKLLRDINCYVNLIPYNETSDSALKKSTKNQIKTFYDILKKNNINVTIRKEFGSKVSAACGQLRANYKEE